MSSVEGGRPTFTTIYKFQKDLNSQAFSIPSTNNPDLGFLGEVISTTQYTAPNNGIEYVVPQNPGIAPTYNPDATQFQINEAIINKSEQPRVTGSTAPSVTSLHRQGVPTSLHTIPTALA